MKKMEEILQREIKQLQPLYLISGEDDYLREQFARRYRKKLATSAIGDFNITRIDDDNENFLYEFNQAVNTVPVMGSYRGIIVTCNNYFINGQPDDDKLAAIIKNIPEYSRILIAVQGGVDKDLKPVKQAGRVGKLINMDPPRYGELDNWIKNKFAERNKTVDRRGIRYLENMFGNHLQKLAGEIEKICLYRIDCNSIKMEDIREIISKDRLLAENEVFSLIDAMCSRKEEKALRILNEMLEDGSQPLRILSSIIWQIKLLLQVKELKNRGKKPKNIAKKLGQHPYPVKKAYKNCQNFSGGELEEIMELLLQVNIDIIYGKYARPGMALEMMIHNII